MTSRKVWEVRLECTDGLEDGTQSVFNEKNEAIEWALKNLELIQPYPSAYLAVEDHTIGDPDASCELNRIEKDGSIRTYHFESKTAPKVRINVHSSIGRKEKGGE